MKRQIMVPAELIKKAAEQLGMVDVAQDEKVLAAIDDYFKTLNDGQYSPMSGEQNNASNSTEVYQIARKHNVDPAKLMKYLGDTAIFDKFKKLSIKEAEEVEEGFMSELVSPQTVEKVLRLLFKKGYNKHVLSAINDYYKSGGTDSHKIASAYNIDHRTFNKYLQTFNRETQMFENESTGFKTVLDDFQSKMEEANHKPAKGAKDQRQSTSNPVARNLGQNTGGAHRSKKDYSRKPKHKGRMQEGMPSRVIKHKERMAALTDDELQSRFEELASRPDFKRKGMSAEDIAAAQEKRHAVKPGTYSGWAHPVNKTAFEQVLNTFEERMDHSTTNEGKQVSVYEAHLRSFLEQVGATFEQGDDCMFVEDALIETLNSNFPEFNGMMKPLSEYADYKPQGFNKDKYVTVADGNAQQYSGTDKGVG